LFASFSPDGRRIVTASEDFTARIWDTATGRPTGLPLKHGHQVTAARFSSDGRWVVTACRDGTARVWDAENNAPLTPPFRHLSALVQAAFLPGDRQLVTTDKQNRIFVWPLSLPGNRPADLAQLAVFLSGAQVSLSDEAELKPLPLLAGWQQLCVKFPGVFAGSEREDARWHECQVQESRMRGDWFAARFHLERLLMLRPEDTSLSEQLSQAKAALSQVHGR